MVTVRTMIVEAALYTRPQATQRRARLSAIMRRTAMKTPWIDFAPAVRLLPRRLPFRYWGRRHSPPRKAAG